MFARLMWVLGLSTVTLGAVQACGSDNGGAARPDEHDASTGGSSGAGGKSSGGKAGMGGGGAVGGGGAGGMRMVGCDTSACDMQLAPIQQALGGFISLTSCCVNATTCGIDTSGFTAILGAGAMLPACVDPNMLTGGNVCPPPIEVPDSGVIPPEDGGSPVQLDKTCPDVTATGVFDLPGCCLPTGLCGGSTHTLCGAGVSVPVACVSYDDIAASAASSFGNTVTVPDDPNIKCRYTAGPTTPGVRDASADSHITPEPDAKPPVPDAAPPKPDAAPPKTPDAAPTSEPDSGGSPPNPQ